MRPGSASRAGPEDALDGEVVGLGAAAGEDHLGRAGAERGGDATRATPRPGGGPSGRAHAATTRCRRRGRRRRKPPPPRRASGSSRRDRGRPSPPSLSASPHRSPNHQSAPGSTPDHGLQRRRSTGGRGDTPFQRADEPGTSAAFQIRGDRGEVDSRPWAAGGSGLVEQRAFRAQERYPVRVRATTSAVGPGDPIVPPEDPRLGRRRLRGTGPVRYASASATQHLPDARPAGPRRPRSGRIGAEPDRVQVEAGRARRRRSGKSAREVRRSPGRRVSGAVPAPASRRHSLAAPSRRPRATAPSRRPAVRRSRRGCHGVPASIGGASSDGPSCPGQTRRTGSPPAPSGSVHRRRSTRGPSRVAEAVVEALRAPGCRRRRREAGSS